MHDILTSATLPNVKDLLSWVLVTAADANWASVVWEATDSNCTLKHTIKTSKHWGDFRL